MQKARGQAKSVKYPQPEQMLADVFTRGGNELNDDSPYGMCKVYTAIASVFCRCLNLSSICRHVIAATFRPFSIPGLP